MARLPRLCVPGFPYHVIQRGNNRQSIFASVADRHLMLDLLGKSASSFGIAVHAYVLMGNHFHLLVTPRAVESLPRMMQAVGRQYVRHFNDVQGRSGTLWEGRYKSSLMQTDRYLFACMVYIDLNPVRAGLVLQAQDYPWSSHGHYAGMRIDPLVSPHPLMWELGNTPFAREASYSKMVQAGITAQQQTALTQSVRSGWALGDVDFVAGLQKKTERRISKSPAGRPRINKRNTAPPVGND